MSLLKQSSTAQPLVFLMVDSADHITPKTGLSPTVTLSKAGGSFASPSGAVTEIGNGWYKVAGNATDTATLGPLILHATGTGADPVDVVYDVVAFDPQTVAVGALMPTTAGRTLTVDTDGKVAVPDTQKVDVNTIKTQEVTASGGITFPSATLASTTNIDDVSTNVYDSITTHVWEAVASTYGTGDTTAGRLNAIKAKTDLIIADMATIATRLLTSIELDGSVYRFTTNALEQAPGGGAGTSEAFLTYDWDGITGEPAHCLLNALRVILNKKTQSPGYINVLKEDGATTAFQVPITTAVSPAVGVTETGVPAQ